MAGVSRLTGGPVKDGEPQLPAVLWERTSHRNIHLFSDVIISGTPTRVAGETGPQAVTLGQLRRFQKVRKEELVR